MSASVVVSVSIVSIVSAVWRVSSAGKTFRIRTCSARTAIAQAERTTRQSATLLGLTFEQRPTPRRTTGPTRMVRRRNQLLAEAVRRRSRGESVTDIAKALNVPRETVRDWLLSVAA